MTPSFAIINHSDASDSDVGYIADACKLYGMDVCAAHGLDKVEVEFVPKELQVPAGWIPIVAFGKPDGDGYLGFHDTLEDGSPYADVYLDVVPGKIVLHDPSGAGASLAGVITHEFAEAIGDLYANLWSDGPLVDLSSGTAYGKVALELCDYVQNRAKPIALPGGTIVDCSNFVTREFFCKKVTKKPFDYMGVLTEACTIDEGGYAIVETSSDAGQVTAKRMKIPHHLVLPPKWRDAHSAMKSMSRTVRRLVP